MWRGINESRGLLNNLSGRDIHSGVNLPDRVGHRMLGDFNKWLIDADFSRSGRNARKSLCSKGLHFGALAAYFAPADVKDFELNPYRART